MRSRISASDCAIGNRDQIHGTLIFNLHVLAKVAHEQAARLASHGLHGRNQIQEIETRCHGDF